MRLFNKFGLNVSSNLAITVTNVLNLFTIPRFTRGSGGNVASSQVNPNYFRSLASGLSWDINNEVDKVVTALGFIQCGAGWFLSPQQCNLITIMTHPVQLILTAVKTARAASLSALKGLSFPHSARFYEYST